MVDRSMAARLAEQIRAARVPDHRTQVVEVFTLDELVAFGRACVAEAQGAAVAPVEYDMSRVIPLTHRKARDIIERNGYSVTGFVLTDKQGRKCIVDMSAVRWFDDPLKFQQMMHPDMGGSV
jgi:hypothetical protein